MRLETKTTLACAAALSVASGMTMFSGVLPILVAVPIFLLASLHPALSYLALLLPGLAMLAWHPGLLRGASRPPIRTSVLAALLAVGQLVWFYVAWEHGLKYQGFWYCVGLLAGNLVLTGLVFVVERTLRQEPGFPANLLFHALVFGWSATLAFPWLGELP